MPKADEGDEDPHPDPLPEGEGEREGLLLGIAKNVVNILFSHREKMSEGQMRAIGVDFESMGFGGVLSKKFDFSTLWIFDSLLDISF
ncbi:MAG: hypothetical protein HGB18_05375 [Candidatus Moranbacteria bacterium]|nr:hypothetical protein [Candidatus Moranbacteria bacterium]